MRRALLAIALLALAALAFALWPREPETALEQLEQARRIAAAIPLVEPSSRSVTADGALAAYDRVERFPDEVVPGALPALLSVEPVAASTLPGGVSVTTLPSPALPAAVSTAAAPLPPTVGAHEVAQREAIDLCLREKRTDPFEARSRRLVDRKPPPADAASLLQRVAETREALADAAEPPVEALHERARDLYLEVETRWKTGAEGERAISAEAAYRAGVILEDRLGKTTAPGDILASWERFLADHPRSPRVPDVLLRLAELYRRIGEKERAIALYRRIADEFPESEAAAKALREIGMVYGEELGKAREAAKAFQELEEKYGDSPSAAGARALREKSEKEAATDEEEDYHEGHYGGSLPDFQDLLAKTPRELLAQLIAMKLDALTLEVDVAIYPDRSRLEAVARLRIQHHGEEPREDLAAIFSSVHVIDEALWEGEKIDAKVEGETLVAALPAPWPPATPRTLTVRYHTEVSRSPALRLLESGYGIGASGWAPCGVIGDSFTVRSTWRVPAGYAVEATGAVVPPPAAAPWPYPALGPRVVSETALESARDMAYRQVPPLGVDEREIEPLDDPPMDASTPTFAFSTGELPVFAIYFAYGKFREERAEWRGRPIAVRWITPGFTRARELLSELRAMLEFYSERFGEPPWPRFSIVEASVHEMGAAGVGPACMLLLETESFHPDAKPPVNLMAHELAHQWWGNAVPVTLAEGWAPWLSEGLASYADALYHERKFGAESARRHLTKYAHLYYQLMLAWKDRPIDEAWGSAGPMYRALAYEKAARILHMLRRWLGDEPFFAGLQKYATDFRFKDSGVDDLRRSLEAASGKDLAPFFDDWTRRKGFPHLILHDARVGAAGPAGVRVEVTIEEEGELFRIPRLVVEMRAKGRPSFRREVAVVTASATFSFDAPFAPEEIALDPDDDVLKLPGRDLEWSAEIARERAVRRGGGAVGKDAPAAVFEGEGGKALPLDARRGKTVALLVYATAAKPCVKAVRALDDALRELGAGGAAGAAGASVSVTALLVSTEPLADQERLRRSTGHTLEIARADEAALDLLGKVKEVPTLFVIDAGGVIRAREVGARSKEAILDLLRARRAGGG